MLLVETRVFTRRVTALLSDEEYRELQLEIVASPSAGALIPGTGGLRKLRWSVGGKGKRGGLRIIYYHHAASARVLLLFIFAKNERSDLTAAQKEQLRRIVESEYP